MQIRKQVKEMFGTAEKGTLLDKSVYGGGGLKRGKNKLERPRKQPPEEKKQ